MKKEIMHVGILDSRASRKNLLEGAVSAIQCLKDFERLRVVRKQKRVYREELFKNINEINSLFSSLEVPRVDYEDTKIVKRLKKKLPKPKEIIQSKSREISQLEDDIKLLQQKISNL